MSSGLILKNVQVCFLMYKSCTKSNRKWNTINQLIFDMERIKNKSWMWIISISDHIVNILDWDDFVTLLAVYWSILGLIGSFFCLASFRLRWSNFLGRKEKKKFFWPYFGNFSVFRTTNKKFVCWLRSFHFWSKCSRFLEHVLDSQFSNVPPWKDF